MTSNTMTNSTKSPSKNFWLWGSWGRRSIKEPFLTQKVPGKIRDVIIGQGFIIALNEDGTLHSWGQDKNGCLGLGTDNMNSPEPRKIPFPSDYAEKVVDIQFGKHHVLALTNGGKVYSWGGNNEGQLGLNDTQGRCEPVYVDGLREFSIEQILAVDNMSYALTSTGQVYAWGENKEQNLALEHTTPSVMRPEPMMRLNGTHVKKLALKECGGSASHGKTVIAFVDLADPIPPEEAIGGYKQELAASAPPQHLLSDPFFSEAEERDIFEAVDLMKKVMDNTQDWWDHILDVRHGSPYDDDSSHHDDPNRGTPRENKCTAQELDTVVGVDILDRASYELDMLVKSAKQQLDEIRNKKGTKNATFMLSLFMDDCKLRKEKIRRTVAARQLTAHKQKIREMPMVHASDLTNDEEKTRIDQANTQLTRALQKIRDLKAYDVFTRSLQDSLVECIECKLQVHETQIQCLNARKNEKSSPIAPALDIIKDRWDVLKKFSIYNIYHDLALDSNKSTNRSEEEQLAFLVHASDDKLDQIISQGRDKLVSHDSMVPRLTYDILTENAELRKMCNTYQLKVLQMTKGNPQKNLHHVLQGS
eukprot:TRINITY_DN17079_c0_g1_i4.p1 TRINITY_DN17079_c0_g1~~TRINITY_DN17079_c0_g1_i4.p1  ORF type:complete len:623 (-),score=107.25 TRINITY_DN17079_c0_g1_i4:14-1780(-)